MVRKIITVPNPKLKVRSKEVIGIDKRTSKLLVDLKDTVALQRDPEGAGLATIQIGAPKRIFTIKRGTKFEIVINPKIIKTSKETNFTQLKNEEIIPEGCLSVPGIYDYVERAWEIEVQYRNERFESVKEAFTGLEAEIFQHEVDHLNGILFTQRALESRASKNYPKVGQSSIG